MARGPVAARGGGAPGAAEGRVRPDAVVGSGGRRRAPGGRRGGRQAARPGRRRARARAAQAIRRARRRAAGRHGLRHGAQPGVGARAPRGRAERRPARAARARPRHRARGGRARGRPRARMPCPARDAPRGRRGAARAGRARRAAAARRGHDRRPAVLPAVDAARRPGARRPRRPGRGRRAPRGPARPPRRRRRRAARRRRLGRPPPAVTLPPSAFPGPAARERKHRKASLGGEVADGAVPRAAGAAPAGEDGATYAIDWMRIERSEDFRELTGRRNRFIAIAATVTFVAFAVYLFLAVFAHGVMGTTILGGVPLAWPLAMSQVLLTWAVTWTYLRKADREFAPLEERIAERAGARFTRDADDAAPEPATTSARPAATAGTPSERSAR